MLAVGAFAVDIPRIYTVKNELQNAADAAALAGAAALTQGGATGTDWQAATAAAQAAVSLNRSDGVKLTSATVNAGYWDLAAAAPTLLPSNTVLSPRTQYYLPEPAVQVTVARNASANGSINLLLGGLMGIPTAADSATAVAVIAPPTTLPAGTVFPMVIDQCIFDQYWNSQTNSPLLDPSGQPYEVGLLEKNSKPPPGIAPMCRAPAWTTYGLNSNSAATLKQLVASKNTVPMSVGDPTYVVHGDTTSVFSAIQPLVGKTVMVPVVGEDEVVAGTSPPIVAFAPFHIQSADGQSCKCILGNFVSGYTVPVDGSGIATTGYGVYVAPRLAE